MTLVFTCLAVVASVILLVTYIIFPSLPSKLIMNLAVSFLAGDICVIVQAALALEGENLSKLEIVGAVSFYFFIAR